MATKHVVGVELKLKEELSNAPQDHGNRHRTNTMLSSLFDLIGTGLQSIIKTLEYFVFLFRHSV